MSRIEDILLNRTHTFVPIIILLSSFYINFTDRLFCTVGVHPTYCSQFTDSGDPDTYLENLLTLVRENRDCVVAIGECGLGKSSLYVYVISAE